MNKFNTVFQKNRTVVDLPEIVFYQEGPVINSRHFHPNGVKLLNIVNLQCGEIILNNTDKYISEEEAYGRYNNFLVDEGDLIIARSGTEVENLEKKMGFIKKEHLPLCLNTNTIRFKSLDESILDIKYFKYFLESNYFKKQLQRLITTDSVQIIFNTSCLKEVKVLLPEINIQKRVVILLDHSEKLINKRKSQIEALDQLTKSVFFDLFGDPAITKEKYNKITLIEACENKDDIRCGPLGTQLQAIKFTKSGIPLWRNRHLNKNFQEPIDEFIPIEKAQKLKPFNLLSGDLVMSRKGVVGKCAIYPDDFPEGIMHSDLLRIRLNKKIVNPTYLMFQFKFSRDIEQQLLQISSGTILQGLNVNKLKEISILIPPKDLQNEFEKLINKIHAQKDILHTSLNELTNNYNSLIQMVLKEELIIERNI
ncbi:restriction endonuclease subunit S [Lysinibacillus xylanilyticus]|uniref:Restriction endonuclease subunit S n=1 Tax=Lysinibacillus xylanilyticus TaxID=582475 RepID=A0ABT4EMY5_9BACI|nr:restriction endonuclease subunit S [Lysinibacillus xylanilyticus]